MSEPHDLTAARDAAANSLIILVHGDHLRSALAEVDRLMLERDEARNERNRLAPDDAVATIRAFLDDAGWSRRQCDYCDNAEHDGHAPDCDVVVARSALDALAREIARLRAELGEVLDVD